MTTLETINAFRALMRSAYGELQACVDERNLCEEAFHDILHFAAMSERTRANQRKTQAMIKEWSARRWNAKNRIKELQPISDFAVKNKFILSELDIVAGKTKKQVEFVQSEKHYNPRVILDLFDNIKDKGDE